MGATETEGARSNRQIRFQAQENVISSSLSLNSSSVSHPCRLMIVQYVREKRQIRGINTLFLSSVKARYTLQVETANNLTADLLRLTGRIYCEVTTMNGY